MIGILIVTCVAFLLSIIIVVLDSNLNIKNPDEEKYLELLPGYNCGACGFGSCKGMAKKMCEDIDNYKKCKLLKGEKLKKMEEYINLLKNKI